MYYMMRVLFIGIASLFYYNAHAGIIEWTNRIHTPSGGTPVQISYPEAIDSVKADIPSGVYNDAQILNRISLGIDIHYPQYFGSAMDIEVQVRVERWDVSMTPLSDTTFWLKVFYSPSDTLQMIALNKTEFYNAYKLVFSVQDIKVNGVNESILPANIYVQGDIFIERYLELGSTPVLSSFTKIDKDCNGVDDAIMISWTHLTGAEEYQLEWAYINDYSNSLAGVLPPNALEYDFKFNSTRIITSDNSYTISLVFDKGWLVYRLRSVGVLPSTPDQFVFGNWSEPEKGVVSDINVLRKVPITGMERHEGTVNWQYAATYAEQGKKKEVVSYFDGTLRNRQTVTRINSDNNIIVGETIYDHQGRPTVTILPVPAADTVCGSHPDNGHSIHLYRNFNVNDSNKAYSATDFDISDTSALCAVGAAEMKTSTGASNYYSSQNPNQLMEQGYVPDAQGYPFVQVEYTADNTGRIRRQGGVGPDFQIGSGRETRYLYGQPNQLELDRLFGSEVGYQSHYQKNVVVDAHGQASISYLDQQGRVIATALAGDHPENLLGIDSESESAVELEVDAFASGANQPGIDNRSLVFSTELVVAYQSAHTFSYDFEITPVDMACLDTICVDCVYDLSIDLIDECGINLAPAALQNRLVGKFTATESGYSFHSACVSPVNGELDTTFTVSLAPGAYSLNKKLTVNQQALDSLVAIYLRSSCTMTLQDFENIALSNIDTSGCEVTCDNCFEQLGSLEDFIASGQGNSNDYYLRVEQCQKLCNGGSSHCEVMETLLRLDMSPGGQYGEYLNQTTGQISESNFPLSIYNPSNLLPNSSAFWRSPVLITPQGQQNIYVDENGERSRIYLTEDPFNTGTWLPQPTNVILIKTEASTQQKYIYPEELLNLEDFVNLFQPSWARSLIVYHPEYCYYETCLIYQEPIELDDAFTSTSFDRLLQQTTTMLSAVDNGFVELNTTSYDLLNWFAPPGGDNTEDAVAWDPFVYYSSDFNSTICNGNYGTQLQNLCINYKYIDGAWRSMPEVAALTARCGTNYAASYPATCYNFGQTVIGVWDNEVLDEEWVILKSLYLSEKQKLQRKLADCRAIKECESYNGCIGNDEFNPFTLMGPFMFSSSWVLPLLISQQPCKLTTYHLYLDKVRRFSDETDLPHQDANGVAYEVYLQTGQCPVEFAVQGLLSAMVQNNELTAPNVNLNSYPQLSAIFQANNNFNMPGTIPMIEHQGSVSGNVLTIDWVAVPSTPISTITMTLGGTASWADVTNIINVYVTGTYSFTAEAVITEIDTVYIETIAGTITSGLATSCNFAPECSSNELAKKLTVLFNTLHLDNAVLSGSPVSINPYVSSTYGTFSGLTNLYIENAAAVGSNLHWQSVSGSVFKVFDPAGNPNDGLYVHFNAAITSGVLSTISHFGNMTSIGENSFKMEAFFTAGGSADVYGTLYREIAGERIGIKSGDCGLPTPLACQTTAHDNFNALSALLNDVLVVQDYDGIASIDLFTSVEMTPSIISSLPFGIDSTASVLSSGRDTLVISAGDCDLILTVEAPHEFPDLIEIKNFSLEGNDISNYGNFYNFKFVGVFFDGTNTVEQTVYGTSCISIKECNPCITPQEYVENEELSRFISEGPEYIAAYDPQLETLTDYDSLVNYLHATYMRDPSCMAYEGYFDCLSRYNDSVLAMGPGSGFFLIQDTVPLYVFEENGMCVRKCDQEFCERISAILSGRVIISSQNMLAMYLDFGNFCEMKPVNNEDPCEETYEQYLDCIAYYNSAIDSTQYPVTSIHDYNSFVRSEMCYCADHICARLNNLLNGLSFVANGAELNEYLSAKACSNYSTPCEPNPVSGTPSIMPEVELNNNCVEMQINQAKFEAQVLYQNYVDSVSNALINQYIAHCLSVGENLNYSYSNKLYHFTLYYYDQAGNLIKTIPPAGVEQLGITSSDDAMSLQIKADRNNKTKTVFTSHRLATRYEYNSLNQLVYQSTPDTDPMDIFEQTLPNGLHKDLITYKIQMVDENTGYLGGEINGRGFIFRTNDGGTTWTRVQDLVGADIKKAIMFNNGNNGIAIGEKGTVLTTGNGGVTWDLIPQIWQDPSLNVIHDLNDIAHIDLGSGDHTFVIVGENRTIVKTDITTSGQVVSMVTAGITEPSTASVTSITTDGTDFFITVNDNTVNTSFVYRLPTGTTTWVAENSFTTGEMKDIHNYNGTGAYAAGDDGRIYKKTNAVSTSERWKLVKNSLTKNVHALRFFNEQSGAALVELQPGKNYLMRTFDGGANWEQMSEHTFNHLSISNNGSHVIAVGNNGRIEVVVPGHTLETIPVEINTTDNLHAGWFDQEPGTPAKAHIIAATATGKVSYTANGFTNHPVWVHNDVVAITGADIISDIRAERGWTSNQTIYGAVVTTGGAMYRLNKQAGSHNVNLFAITGAGTAHKGLTTMGTKIFSVDKTADELVSVSMSASLGDYNVIDNLDVDVSAIIGLSDHIIGAGNGMLLATLNGTHTAVSSQQDESMKNNPNKLLSIFYNSSNVICSGEDGVIYLRKTSPSVHWERMNTGINQTVYKSVYFPSATAILAAGENGLLASGLVSGSDITGWYPFQTPSGATVTSQLSGSDLYDFTIVNGTDFYAVGQNGKVVYSPAVTANSFSVYTTAGQKTLYGVAALTAGSVLICGEEAYMETRTGANKMVNKYLLPPPVRDLHFSNAQTGTYLADNFVIRTTTAGGNVWNVVYPNTVQAPTGTYRKVWTKSASESYIFGDNTQYRTTGSGLASPVSITGYTVNNVRAIAQGANANELHLVNNENVVKLNFTTNAATNLISLGSGALANALHVFNNGDYLAVGENGLYKHYSATGTVLQDNPPVLAWHHYNDIVFTDNITGTLVGDDGAYFNTINPTVSPSGYLTSTGWSSRDVTNSNDVLGATNMHLYTIDFATPTSGIFGGTYLSGSYSKPYVRKIFDANSRYSSRFFYDKLGRLVVSQNARQYNGAERKFSYTLYDALGRVIEAGEKNENTGVSPRFANVFGTSVSNFFNPSVIDDVQLAAWINAPGERREVTKSYYDHNHILGLSSEFDTDYSTQNKRIVHVTYEELYDGNDQTYDHATHYRYDIHGNVKTLVQDNRKMAGSFPSIASQRFKRMDYAYDLVSGNVHRMSVQNGQPDQWHHAFVYDADNRLTTVYTSTTTPLVGINGLAHDMQNELNNNSDWQNDARYFYYDHGPLSRVEIGENNLQGVDYYYNLQGWLKGVNSSVIEQEHDPGKDSDQAGDYALFAKDVFGFGLHYYQNDYTAISGATPHASVSGGSHAATNSHDLYNGNIRYMQTAITNPNTRDKMPMLNAYKYDQLNRLNESRSYETGLASNAWNPTAYNWEYFNAFSYDANGNIRNQDRRKRDGTQIERLTYRYHRTSGTNKLVRNRLYHVNDLVSPTLDDTDIDDMGLFYANSDSININNNYVYDEEGRLVKDKQEEIDTIIWRVDGKVKEIRRPLTSAKKNIIFEYNSFGQRIAKHVENAQTLMLEKSTYYILDAQGQQLSMYEHIVDTAEVKYYLAERNIYGSSRLGTTKDTVNMYNPQPLPSYGVLGNRNYELNNHLGNVLMVINDHITPLDENTDDEVDGYQVGINNTFDYSPFGVHLDGRTIERSFQLCTETTTTDTIKTLEEGFGNWFTWTTMGNGLITYVSGEMQVSNPNNGNRNIGASKEFNAGEGLHKVTFDIIGNTCATIVLWPPSSTPKTINVYIRDNANNIVASGNYTTAGSYSLSFTPSSSGTYKIEFYMANANAFCFFRVDNVLITYVDEVITTVCEQRPASYRYGFQNQERDDEIAGKGNSYTAEFWQYDSRLGRRWNIDPVVKHNESPYATFANNPIYFNDPDGKDAIITIDGNNITVSAKIYIMNGGKNKINVAKAQKAIMKYWGKEFSYTDEEGKKYNVKFDIQVMEANGTEDPNDASKNWVRPMDENFRSNVSNNRYGKWAKDQDDKTYAHEVGHMFGLADQYTDIEFDAGNLDIGGHNGTRKSVNYNNTLPDELMGATKNEFRGKEKVSQRDIDAIAKYALDRYKAGKLVDGKVILDGGRLLKDGYRNGLAAPSASEVWDTSEDLPQGWKMVSPHED